MALSSLVPRLLAVVIAFAFNGAILPVSAQYNDGCESVNLPTDPVQIRLAYQGPSAMMVSWNTFEQLSNPTVAYGLTADALTLSATSTVSVTYSTSLTYNNHVNITDLLPFTTYYYLPQYSNATTPYSFTTARTKGDTTPFSVGVVVDMGTFGVLGLSTTTGTGAANPLRVNEQTTIAAMEELIDEYEFMIQAGDMAYADYWLKEEIQDYLPVTTTEEGAVVFEHILNSFYDELINVTSAKAYMVNAGNHEANCDNGGTTNKTSGVAFTESICLPGQTNFTGYINHWRMPSGPSGGVGNFWYSYDYGMVHFVHIDTETDLGNGLVGPDEGSPEFGGPFGSSENEQVDWFAADLAAVNRTITPWIVVFGHRGWYLSASSSTCPNCQEAFEEIMHENDVDLYINGHAHIYERSAPTYNNVIDPNGLNNPYAPLYLTNGAAGHYDGLDTFTAIQPYSVYHQAADYAWTTVSFTNATHLTVNSMWSANNTVFDSATLYKAHVYPRAPSSSSSSSSLPTSTTSTPTTKSTASTTNTAVYPTYTNFFGEGHLLVFVGGAQQGDVGSGDEWYDTPGQSTATYTAVPAYPNNTAFTIQHSSDYCAIDSDASFDCQYDASDATLFGQTADGNLTYEGSELWYASSAASSGAKPTVYATPLPVTFNIVWAFEVTATSSSSTTATSSSSSSSTVGTTSSSGPTSTSSSSSSSSSSSTVTATVTILATTTSTSTILATTTSTSTDLVTTTETVTLPSTITDFTPGATVTQTLAASTTTITPPPSTVILPPTTTTTQATAYITKTKTGTTTSTSLLISTKLETIVDTAIVTSTKFVTTTTTDTIVETAVAFSTTTKISVVTDTLTSTSTKLKTAVETVTATSTKTKN